MGARFVMSASSVDQLPDLGLPEAAFAGRSNVGKSSLLGVLIGRSKMVRTSRTPGRTQLLNLFVLDERLALVDLPGYGYAKLAKHKRSALEALMRSYLAQREPLRGVVLLLDARREAVSDLDRRFAEWSLEAKRALLVVITKIDLVPKPRRLHQARRIEEDLGIPAGTAVLCSARTGEGRQELGARLLELGS